ncbi:MAG: exonuclease domain-containing protein [Micrococcales bacterium]|nr:exonuclease domain-containing protein [Micrococcales bacterium]
MPLRDCPLVGFDTETTGTSTQKDRIVTAALVRRAADGTTTERAWLINPGVEIPAVATAVHGITTEFARANGQEPAQALEAIAAQLANALASGLAVVAFNASFDLRILEAELARNGLESLSQRLGGEVRPVLDPLVIDRGVDRYRRGKRKLGDLMGHYRIRQTEHLHDAAADVRATIAVLDAIAVKFSEVNQMDLGDLHSKQQAWHKDWATSFNQFLESKGRAPDVDLRWP